MFFSYAKGKRNPLKDSGDLVRTKKNAKRVKVSTDEHADIGIGLIIIPLNYDKPFFSID